MTIDSFSGLYRWLSNFWPAQVVYMGDTFPSVENAYQAAKSADPEVRFRFTGMPPRDAKREGRQVAITDDWEYRKDTVMLDLLRQKFAKGTVLAEKLVATLGHDLVEGNHWGDVYWGVCNGRGLNKLGVMLMQVRAEVSK